MARNATSARGELVDFDILAIKQQLASAPISSSTEERRTFIDTKNGVKLKPKTRNALLVLQSEIIQEATNNLQDRPEALQLAMEPTKKVDIKNSDEIFDEDEE